ncbi:hypothetical protein EJ110_NYTH55686, partial [Nymphaea thermarum]
AAYDYIFIWDEDLGVEHFDAERYIDVIKRHGLEISQPGVDAKSRLTWGLSRKRNGNELKSPGVPVQIFHHVCGDNGTCVLSRRMALRVNDLVHGWGLDLFGFRRCVNPAHEKIGVVDSQWIAHLSILSLLERVNQQVENRQGKR